MFRIKLLPIYCKVSNYVRVDWYSISLILLIAFTFCKKHISFDLILNFFSFPTCQNVTQLDWNLVRNRL